jgi:hypothetical protein
MLILHIVNIIKRTVHHIIGKSIEIQQLPFTYLKYIRPQGLRNHKCRLSPHRYSIPVILIIRILKYCLSSGIAIENIYKVRSSNTSRFGLTHLFRQWRQCFQCFLYKVICHHIPCRNTILIPSYNDHCILQCN